jgi:hypothetical protein
MNLDFISPCIVVSTIIGGFFVAWFIVCILAQFTEDTHEWMPHLSAIGLIPRWAFFAPRPGMDDTYLLYRDRDEAGTFGTLTCLTMPETRHWFHFVWNPKKFHNKVIMDLMSSLAVQKRQISEEGGHERSLILTVPYMALLHFVMRMPHDQTAMARQFVIVHNRPYMAGSHLVVDFVSEVHPFSNVAESCS